MTKHLLTSAAVLALVLGSFAPAQAQETTTTPAATEQTAPTTRGGHQHARRHAHKHPLDQMVKRLNLSAEQQAQVQPIIDKARPQMQALHRGAARKKRQVMDDTMAQIRPLLTAEQQQKLDAMRQAREQKQTQRQQRRAARQQ